MDIILVYSRMHVIRNFKRLWFITKWNFTVPSLSVPYNSSWLCLLPWSTAGRHTRPMKTFISVLVYSLVSHLRLKLGWVVRIYWFIWRTVLSKISSVMRFTCFGGDSGFPRLTNDPRLFSHNILPWNVEKLCCILFLLYSYLDLVYIYYFSWCFSFVRIPF